MNERELEAVALIARRNGISSGAAAERFMLYGTGELQRRDNERARWDARVDAEKAARKAGRRK